MFTFKHLYQVILKYLVKQSFPNSFIYIFLYCLAVVVETVLQLLNGLQKTAGRACAKSTAKCLLGHRTNRSNNHISVYNEVVNNCYFERRVYFDIFFYSDLPRSVELLNVVTFTCFNYKTIK